MLLRTAMQLLTRFRLT